MQVFSPYSDFDQIAKCLDPKRLNKQKVEICQILNTIALGEKAKGWKNHPATRMVRGFELFFIDYAISITRECLNKGWKDTLLPKFNFFKENIFKNKEYKVPEFWGTDKFHSSHRAALLYKNFEYYSKFGWGEKPELNYYWPK